MFEIKKISQKYNLKIVEDCAQSHFADIKGKKIGTFGDFATFSFFPGKKILGLMEMPDV